MILTMHALFIRIVDYLAVLLATNTHLTLGMIPTISITDKFDHHLLFDTVPKSFAQIVDP